MILLCEDGCLRIYMANVENTSYWLQPSLQPSSVISIMKLVLASFGDTGKPCLEKHSRFI